LEKSADFRGGKRGVDFKVKWPNWGRFSSGAPDEYGGSRKTKELRTEKGLNHTPFLAAGTLLIKGCRTRKVPSRVGPTSASPQREVCGGRSSGVGKKENLSLAS